MNVGKIGLGYNFDVRQKIAIALKGGNNSLFWRALKGELEEAGESGKAVAIKEAYEFANGQLIRHERNTREQNEKLRAAHGNIIERT